MKFISPKLHGILDHAVAATLIGAPLLFDFAASSPAALWIALAGGVALLAYSLLTDYAAGLRALIPFRVHLTLDALAGAVLIAAPHLFGFGGTARAFYLVMGAADLLVVAFSRSRDESVTVAAPAVGATH